MGGPVYFGGWLENGDAFEEWADAGLKTNGGTGVVMDTLIGPVVIAGSWSWDGRLAHLRGRRAHVPLTKGLQRRRPFVPGCAYFAGRTWTCMKLSWALIERISITVLVCGLRTPAEGVAGRQVPAADRRTSTPPAARRRRRECCWRAA